jgi:VWFA-related protein
MTRLPRVVIISFFVWLLLAATGLFSQDQSGQTVPIFTSRTNLVLVPTVVEEGGKHVSGLTKDDFVIKENGKEKPIAVFEVVNTTSNLMARTPNQKGVYTNEVTGDNSPKRLTIFALDTVNTPFLDQKYAREQLIKFLARRIDSKEPCALVSIQSNGIRVIHDFASDPAVLVAALKKVTATVPSPNPGLTPQALEQASPQSASQGAQDVGNGNGLRLSAIRGGDTGAQIQQFSTQEAALDSFISGGDLRFATFAQANRIRVTLEAFQHVAEAFAGVPGRKSLVWATASFPFGLDPTTGTLLAPRVFTEGTAVSANTMSATGDLPALPGSKSEEADSDLKALAPEYERTIQMLNDANISLYPVDARGLVTFFADATTSQIAGIHDFNSALFESSRETMEGFAEMTGGKAFYNSNDLDSAFGKAADDSNSYYMIGYYLDKNAKPGWHKLQVKTKKSGHVRARNGFFVTAENKQKDTQRMDVKLALASPLDYTGISMSVRWTGAQAAGAKKKVSFQIMLPPSAGLVDEANNNHLSLEMVAVARTATGAAADQFAEHLEANLKPEEMPTLHKDGVNYNSNIQVAPGEYSVRFVVRDDISGRLGSVSAPLRVAP